MGLFGDIFGLFGGGAYLGYVALGEYKDKRDMDEWNAKVARRAAELADDELYERTLEYVSNPDLFDEIMDKIMSHQEELENGPPIARGSISRIKRASRKNMYFRELRRDYKDGGGYYYVLDGPTPDETYERECRRELLAHALMWIEHKKLRSDTAHDTAQCEIPRPKLRNRMENW